MRNIRLTIQYDGSRYSGWQFQKNSKTIQDRIERSLRQIVSEKVRLRGASRTDAGVHAQGQVANFKTRSMLPPQSLQKALNSALPKDIVIADSREVSSDFNAQFDARWKSYRYTVINSDIASPFLRKYAAIMRQKLDVSRMRKAARFMIGKHDFRSFQSQGSSVRNSKRTVKELTISRKGNLIVIDIEADGFLYNMARSIVGTLTEVGRGKITPGSVKQIIARCDRKLSGPTAPAKGLCLMKVTY